MMRTELKSCLKQYMRKICDEEGNQESNLTKEEMRGLKSLKKKFKNEEIIVLPTDKSGRFSGMSRSNYLKAVEKHKNKDDKVDLSVTKKAQNELNGNVSMMIKFCKIGNDWKHGDRIRTSMMGQSLNLCPMYLTFKDHKGWTGDDNSPPPTRPIPGGNAGMNIHISEILS